MKRFVVYPVILVGVMIVFTCFSSFAQDEDEILNFKSLGNVHGFKSEINFTRTGDLPPVLFSHVLHAEVNSCSDCHSTEEPIFKKALSKEGYLMKDMEAGRFCGTCHDGKKAFDSKGDCAVCHNSK